MNRAQRRATGSSQEPPLPKVTVATVHPGEISVPCIASINRAREHMLQYGMLPGWIERKARSQHVYRGRNELVAGFLRTDHDYLLFVDADMGIPEDAIAKLLADAHLNGYPIVAGLCFAQRDVGFSDYDYSTTFDVFPTTFVWHMEDGEPTSTYDILVEYPRDSLVQIDATGAACVMIHRTVFEKIRADHGDHWFTPLTNLASGNPCGEDLSFFIRCRDLEIPLVVDTSVKTSHDKGGVFLNEELWDLQQALRPMKVTT